MKLTQVKLKSITNNSFMLPPCAANGTKQCAALGEILEPKEPTYASLKQSLEDARLRENKWAEDCAKAEAQVEQLGRQVAEMSKPMTDEEWDAKKIEVWGFSDDREPPPHGFAMTRGNIDNLIASRARTK